MNATTIFTHAIISLTALACSQSRAPESTTGKTYLSEADWYNAVAELGEMLNGDFRKFTGATQDSSIHIELVLDRNHKFAIRHRSIPFERTVQSDSGIVKVFFLGDEYSNKSIGRWAEQGSKIRLQFILGSKDWFTEENTLESVEIVSDKIILLQKNTDEIWISRTRLKRL